MPKDKTELRAYIAAATDEFLTSGGKITECKAPAYRGGKTVQDSAIHAN